MGLGCARHTVEVYDRGGTTRLGSLDVVTSVQWGRVRDDISMANVTVQYPSQECIKLLQDLEPQRHELVIFRDGERKWEGPVTLITYSASNVEIQARDVLHYAHRTIDRHGHDNAYPNIDTVVHRALDLLNDELVRWETITSPANVLPHVVAHELPTDAQTSKATLPYQMTIYEDIDAMAARSGLDYTVIGRAIHLWDTNAIIGQTAQVSEKDFIDGGGGAIKVSMYGMEHATYAAVTDAQGNWGEVGGIDPYYGIWEILDTAYDEATAAPGAAPPSVEEMTSQAQRNINGRNPVPVVVRIPDGSRLNPDGVLTIDDLVPGVHVPLVATLTARTFSQMQKLDKMTVTETADGEAVTVTLSPASAEDEPEEED